MSKDVIIEVLTKQHDRKNFDCGIEALNNYLKGTALQHHARDIAKTHVLTHKEGDGSIIAFATLNVAQIATQGNESHPGFKGQPRSIPALRLCKLAVHHEHQGKGASLYMMGFTFAKANEIARDIGCTGILVDAKDQQAKQYYERYGFVALTTEPMTLFMAMSTVRQLVSEEAE